MNSESRIQEFQRLSVSLPIVTVTGHGTLLPDNSSFEVPADKYVIYISNPGYWLSLKIIKEDKIMGLFRSAPKLHKFLTDSLPASEIPDIITKHNWNWKRHIYAPRMMCPNLGLEMYDKAPTSWGRWYDSQCGVKIVGESSVYYKNDNKTLKQILANINGPAVVFVFGCRGDPDIYNTMKSSFKHGPQNYPLLATKLSENTKAHEKMIYRMMSKRVPTPLLSLKKSLEPSSKRRRVGPSPSPSKKRKSSQNLRAPSAKKRRVTKPLVSMRILNINHMIRSILRNKPTTTRNYTQLRNMVHQKSAINGKNYTLAEINRVLANLRSRNAI
jgi:hypothetical protein